MLEEVLGDERLARRPTTAYVAVDALRHNVARVRATVGSGREIMAVVKANAYGHGLVPAARALLDAGVDALGVAFLEEGVALRRAGVTAPILVLGGIIGNQVRHFIEHELDITAASPFKMGQIQAAAEALGRRARVHLKVDTGMERLGIHWDNAEDLFEAAAGASRVDVVGIFSHLAQSEDLDPSFTALQTRRFLDVLRSARACGLGHARAHLANSGGVFGHPATHLDMVRPGLALYGVGPYPGLRPALRLQTRVVYFKVVRAGSPVSYGGTWTAPRDTRVVTLPVGYGDGYTRALSNKAEVIVRGRRCPVIGRVTMDATMVDIGPDGTAYNGDPVVLLGEAGEQSVSVEELAAWADTIPYEILTSISARVPPGLRGRSGADDRVRVSRADHAPPVRGQVELHVEALEDAEEAAQLTVEEEQAARRRGEAETLYEPEDDVPGLTVIVDVTEGEGLDFGREGVRRGAHHLGEDRLGLVALARVEDTEVDAATERETRCRRGPSTRAAST